jgi:hypothetical protein
MGRVSRCIRSALANRDAAQDTFEYVIVIGLVVVVMMGILLAGFSGLVRLGVGAMCPSVDTATPTPTCIVP